jgi:hypothetical protein
MEFISANEIHIIRWLHILAMVYWLGGEWGVFQSSYFVVNRSLSLEERRRHMETAYRIDILARTGIILLLPLGLHMGTLYGFVPVLEGQLTLMWLIFAVWLSLTWSAFFLRETDRGIKLSKADEFIRYFVIPALFITALAAMSGAGPVEVSEGNYWYPAKMLSYSLMLVIGLLLRYIMREWTTLFRILAEGPDEKVEARLEWSISKARLLAYIYWIGIATTAFFGAVKPF